MRSLQKSGSKSGKSVVHLENALLRLTVSSAPGSILLEDRKRQTRWRMDPPTYTRAADPVPRHALPSPQVFREGDALVSTYFPQEGAIQIRWELGQDHVKVRLMGASIHMDSIDLPGIFRPLRGRAQLLIPTYQGVLYRGGDEPWVDIQFAGGHSRLSLSLLTILGEKSALMYTAETPTDWCGRFGEDAVGPFATLQMERCAVHGWYEREVRLYPVPADITSIALRYRRRVQERNEFVSWDEKIARKPILKNLFGACMAFIGYNKAAGLDYAANARRMYEYGFKRVLYYPVRMCNYSLNFLMGGDDPIWLGHRELARMHEVPGALIAPWGWYFEGLDDQTPRMQRLFKHNAAGVCHDGWRIEEKQWKHICTPYQAEESKRRFKGDMKAMDWIHYDVSATQLGQTPCFRTDHALHDNQPMGRREDMLWIRRLMSPETNGNRIVSSEGFADRYTPSYDIGSTKLMVDPRNPRAIPVPLTGLVFHDSTLHDWWELHNYNPSPCWGISFSRFGATGNGWGARKAAQDALYGCPPNVFPFGRQYGWTDVASRRTFSYQLHFEDQAVQDALALALPVANLHAQIGRCAMTSFEFLSEDGLLQSTRFSDGTRIIANLGDHRCEAPRLGVLSANQWKKIR
jgi:hypothetical protein